MAQAGVRFARIHGRIVPIHAKGQPGPKGGANNTAWRKGVSKQLGQMADRQKGRGFGAIAFGLVSGLGAVTMAERATGVFGGGKKALWAAGAIAGAGLAGVYAAKAMRHLGQSVKFSAQSRMMAKPARK
jgi:hypothetical protein